jgi:hypothetical protein
MFQTQKTQQPTGRDFPGWEPTEQMRSTPASQQVVPDIVQTRSLTLLISNPSAQRGENEVLDLGAIRF